MKTGDGREVEKQGKDQGAEQTRMDTAGGGESGFEEWSEQRQDGKAAFPKEVETSPAASPATARRSPSQALLQDEGTAVAVPKPLLPTVTSAGRLKAEDICREFLAKRGVTLPHAAATAVNGDSVGVCAEALVAAPRFRDVREGGY